MLFQLNGTNPFTAIFCDQADISNLCQFGSYEWVKCRDRTEAFPYQQECLGPCLGPAKNEGNEIANWVLTIKGTVVPCRTRQPLTDGEKSVTNVVEEGNRKAFTAAITSKLGNSLIRPPKLTYPTIKEEFKYDLYVEDDLTPMEIHEADLAGRVVATQKSPRHTQYPIYINKSRQVQISPNVRVP